MILLSPMYSYKLDWCEVFFYFILSIGNKRDWNVWIGWTEIGSILIQKYWFNWLLYWYHFNYLLLYDWFDTKYQETISVVVRPFLIHILRWRWRRSLSKWLTNVGQQLSWVIKNDNWSDRWFYWCLYPFNTNKYKTFKLGLNQCFKSGIWRWRYFCLYWSFLQGLC